MKFYEVSKPLYLELTDASSIGLGAGLLQVRDGINCGQGSEQHSIAPHCICKQGLIQCVETV